MLAVLRVVRGALQVLAHLHQLLAVVWGVMRLWVFRVPMAQRQHLQLPARCLEKETVTLYLAAGVPVSLGRREEAQAAIQPLTPTVVAVVVACLAVVGVLVVVPSQVPLMVVVDQLTVLGLTEMLLLLQPVLAERGVVRQAEPEEQVLLLTRDTAVAVAAVPVV